MTLQKPITIETANDHFPLRIAEQHCGCLSTEGKWLIPPEYDDVRFYNTHIAIVQKKGLYGVVSSQNKTIAPLKYKYICNPNHKGWMVFNTEQNKRGLMDNNGRTLIEPKYEYISTNNISDNLLVQENNLYGMIDISQNTIISPKFYEADYLSHDYIRVTKNNKKGFISPYGQEIIAPRFDWMTNFFKTEDSTHYISLIKEDLKYGVITHEGEYFITPEYDELDLIERNPNLFLIVNKDALWGIINHNKETLFMKPFDHLVGFKGNNNLGGAKKDGKWGIVNAYGEMITPFEFDNYPIFFGTNEYAFTKSAGTLIIIDRQGKDTGFTSDKPTLQGSYFDENNIAIAHDNYHGYGFITGNGLSWGIKPKYNHISRIYFGKVENKIVYQAFYENELIFDLLDKYLNKILTSTLDEYGNQIIKNAQGEVTWSRAIDPDFTK